MAGKPEMEIRKLCPELEPALAEFFAVLESSGIGRTFHPHPFTAEEAGRRCAYDGADLYYVVTTRGRVLGYGMLRGWDEGYEIPSLGIALSPEAQGKGLGKLFMLFLHAAARYAGAKKIRLKVYPGNSVAVKLYESLGYRYEGMSEGQLVGFVDL